MSGRVFYPFVNLKVYHSSKRNCPLPESQASEVFVFSPPQIIQVIVLFIIMGSSSSPKPQSGLSWVSKEGWGPLLEPSGHGRRWPEGGPGLLQGQ